MSTLSPSEALRTCERALRQLMRHAYRAEWGDDWLAHVASEELRDKWTARKRDETQARASRGVAQLPDDELEYAQLFELRDIAYRHWSPLHPALGDRKETAVLLKRFDRLRNSVAHSRDILPFERDIMSGIAGEIRNKVTIYMSSQDPAGDYFPRIESITDSFGNTFNGSDPNSPNAFISTIQTGLGLRVGDTVTFDCVGTDPHGRELEWELHHSNMAQRSTVERARGQQATLVWKVEDKHVRINATVVLLLTTVDATYHRFNGYDEQVDWIFDSVLPPEGAL